MGSRWLRRLACIFSAVATAVLIASPSPAQTAKRPLRMSISAESRQNAGASETAVSRAVEPASSTSNRIESVKATMRSPASPPELQMPEPDDSPAASAETAASSGNQADAPLRPIADPSDSGPAEIEPASFKGVTPGVSTMAEVEKAWGVPKEMRKQDEVLMQLYSVEPFDRIEVSYSEDKVTAIIIRLAEAFPADGVAKQLQLSDVRPVLVSNEFGEILGESFPERGVLFAFEPSQEPSKPSMKVAQIILEPVNAEPFVLRAETNLEARAKASQADLEMALKLDPQNVRALWLHARVLVSVAQYDKALASIDQAVEADDENPHYHVTRAQILGQLGRFDEAARDAERAVETSKSRPHVHARALCLLGDLTASGPKPDYRKALTFHTDAVKAADALSSEKHTAIRTAAKEVLVDAHLGAAHDIAWGDWKDKELAVKRWLDRAAIAAEDLRANEQGGDDHAFRVSTRALAVCVGLRGSIDPTPWTQQTLKIGQDLIDDARDPVRKAQLEWDLGMALYDALQSYQMRGDQNAALRYGEDAVGHLASANQARPSSATSYMLGRLYFRLGAIHSVQDQNHREAIAWFDKAIPLLQKANATEAASDPGRQGETFVSMGVSYWEASQRKKAVDLTAQGVALMEKGVKQGAVDEAALAIPYGNLAAMHRQLGATEAATRYQKMAARIRAGNVR